MNFLSHDFKTPMQATQQTIQTFILWSGQRELVERIDQEQPIYKKSTVELSSVKVFRQGMLHIRRAVDLECGPCVFHS